LSHISFSPLIFNQKQPASDLYKEEASDAPNENVELSLDERKLKYVHFVGGVEARTPSTVWNSVF
jgi:hypothetical protein